VFLLALLFNLSTFASDFNCTSMAQIGHDDKLIDLYECQTESGRRMCFGKNVQAKYVVGIEGIVYFTVGGEFDYGLDQFWVYEAPSEEPGKITESENEFRIEKTTFFSFYDNFHRMSYDFAFNKKSSKASLKIKRTLLPGGSLIYKTVADETYTCRKR